MKTVMLRNVEVGCGKPKVIVPIVAATAQGILEKAREFRAHALDVVEWRVDFYEDVFQLPKVLSTLKGLREILGETPILFTFRTRKEGGEKEIDMEAYTALNTAVAQSGDADAVDVEVFSGDEVVRRNIQAIHAAGKAVVGSNHDFGGTPDKADLLFRLRKMQELGADIPKIAVMPRCPGGRHPGDEREVRRPAHHHHVHGGRGGQPPVRGVLRLGHDLRRGGPGLRPRADPRGGAERRHGYPPPGPGPPELRGRGINEPSSHRPHGTAVPAGQPGGPQHLPRDAQRGLRSAGSGLYLPGL